MDNEARTESLPKRIAETAKGIISKTTAKRNSLRYIAVAGAALLLTVVLIVVIGALSNRATSAIGVYEKAASGKLSTSKAVIKEVTNGFATDELLDLYGMLKKAFPDDFEDFDDSFAETKDENKKAYGDNFKIKVTLAEDGKEEFEKSRIKEVRDDIHDLGDKLREIVKKTKGYDGDDWEELAYKFDLTKSQVKKLMKYVEAFAEELRDAKITDGYELECDVVTTGSKLDEPIETSVTVYAIKINGRWVNMSLLYTVLYRFSLFITINF